MHACQQLLQSLMPGASRVHERYPLRSSSKQLLFFCLVRRSQLLFFTSLTLRGTFLFHHMLGEKSVWERGHPNGTLLATGGEDHALLVWQGLSGNVLLRIHGHEGPIYDVARSPDGRRIASCGGSGRKGELFVWDAKLGTRLRVLEGHSSPVFSVVWSSDGTQLVSGGTDGALHWWDLDQSVSPETVQAHKGWVHLLRLSPDGKVVASTEEDGEITLWELHSHRHLVTLRRARPYERLKITGTTGLS